MLRTLFFIKDKDSGKLREIRIRVFVLNDQSKFPQIKATTRKHNKVGQKYLKAGGKRTFLEGSNILNVMK